MLESFAVVRFAAHERVLAEAVEVGTQGLPRHSFSRHRAPAGQYIVAGASAEGDAFSDGCGPQERVQPVVGGGTGFDERRQAIGAPPVSVTGRQRKIARRSA